MYPPPPTGAPAWTVPWPAPSVGAAGEVGEIGGVPAREVGGAPAALGGAMTRRPGARTAPCDGQWPLGQLVLLIWLVLLVWLVLLIRLAPLIRLTPLIRLVLPVWLARSAPQAAGLILLVWLARPAPRAGATHPVLAAQLDRAGLPPLVATVGPPVR